MVLTMQMLPSPGCARRRSRVSAVGIERELFICSGKAVAPPGRPGRAVSAWSRALGGWKASELEAAIDVLLAADYAPRSPGCCPTSRSSACRAHPVRRASPCCRVARGAWNAARRALALTHRDRSVVISSRSRLRVLSSRRRTPSSRADGRRLRTCAADGHARSGCGGSAVIDSVVAATAEDTPRYAEALFWRASSARRPQRPSATSSAHQRGDIRRRRGRRSRCRAARELDDEGDRARARVHSKRIECEYPTGNSVRASVALARLAFDDG